MSTLQNKNLLLKYCRSICRSVIMYMIMFKALAHSYVQRKSGSEMFHWHFLVVHTIF